jgi:hypothetical protein
MTFFKHRFVLFTILSNIPPVLGAQGILNFHEIPLLLKNVFVSSALNALALKSQ